MNKVSCCVEYEICDSGCVCFDFKSFPEMLFRKSGYGSTQKIRSTVNDFRFDRKMPLFWCKMISVAIFTSKYFRTQTRRERERERERERREIANPKTDSDFDSDKPRNRLRLTQKTQDRENPFVKPIRSHPENPFNCTISDPHRADRTTGEIVAPQHRSTQNRSFSSHPKTDRSRAIFVGY